MKLNCVTYKYIKLHDIFNSVGFAQHNYNICVNEI